MSWAKRLRNVFRSDRLSSDIDREMAFHLAEREDDLRARGHSPDAAHHEARRRFGNVTIQKENVRERDLVAWLETILTDLKYAARGLRASPAFSLVAIASLALGIGATTAIFTAVNAVMLRPLGVPHARQLAYLSNGHDESFTYQFYNLVRERMTTFAGLAAVEAGAAKRDFLASGGDASGPDQVRSQAVTGSFFPLLGVPALVGRTLTPDDDRADAEPAVVISSAYWRRRFGADPAIVGKRATLDRVPVTIVGIMPDDFVGFEIGLDPDVWWPMQLVPRVDGATGDWGTRLTSDGIDWLVLFGRLRAGVSLEQASAEGTALLRQSLTPLANKEKWTPSSRKRILSQSIDVHPGGAGYVSVRSKLETPLRLLFAAVALVLFIACANVAGLLLARGTAREREFALRASLGGSRARLVRQLVTESVVLSVIGGTFGLILARVGTTLLTRYFPSDATPVSLAPDARVLFFAAAVSVVTGVLFGLAPALRLSRADLLARANAQGLRTTGTKQRLQPLLVTAQIALSVLLLSGAALFARTLHNLRMLDLGFKRDDLVAFSLDWQGRMLPYEMGMMERRVLQGIATIQDISNVTIAGAGMLSGNGYNTGFRVDGYAPAPDEEMRVSVIMVGPKFFDTMRSPLLRGREFMSTEEPLPEPDRVGVESSTVPPPPPPSARVAILGEAMATKYFGDVNPIGRHITLGLKNGVRYEIVGVARDTKYLNNLRAKTPLELYLPYFGTPVHMPGTIYLRTSAKLSTLAPAIRRVVAESEKGATVAELRTMDEMVDALLVRERLVTQLVGFFSAFAIALASLGLYGLLSYGVARRTREIGVRVALGATIGDVARLVVRQGVVLACVGCVIGIAGALGLTRLVASLLYGVGPNDPISFVAVGGILMCVAALACWLPARRATRVDPIIALRSD